MTERTDDGTVADEPSPDEDGPAAADLSAATDDSSPGAGGDRVYEIAGVEIVLEEEFVEFPWRAGMKRAPVALGTTFAIVLLLAAIGGIGGGSIAGTVVYLVLVIYGLHNIPLTRGTVPDVLDPVAEHLFEIPYLRGFVLTGPNHGDPVGHVVDIATGKTESIGHISSLPSNPTLPIEVYAAVPALVLIAVGIEFALRYWETVTVDTPVELLRFGAAIGLGYVLVLLLGSFLVSSVGLAGILIPDRYVTLIFGFVYPAFFATVGATLVYVQQEYLHSPDAADAAAGDRA